MRVLYIGRRRSCVCRCVSAAGIGPVGCASARRRCGAQTKSGEIGRDSKWAQRAAKHDHGIQKYITIVAATRCAVRLRAAPLPVYYLVCSALSLHRAEEIECGARLTPAATAIRRHIRAHVFSRARGVGEEAAQGSYVAY